MSSGTFGGVGPVVFARLLGQDDAGGSGGSAGVALVLLIGIVLLAVWVFRRTTRSTEPAVPPPAPRDTAAFEPSTALRVATWSLIGVSFLGLVLPVLGGEFGSSGRLSEAGGEIVVYFIVAWCSLIVGGAVKWRTAEGTAIAQGAAIGFGGYLIFITSAFWAVVYLGDGFIDAGPGVIFLTLSGAACIWLVALRRPPGASVTAGPAAGAHVALLVGGVLTALGIMLPPNDSGLSFRDVNFSWSPAVLQVTWLLLVFSFLVPSLLAFRDRTPVGLGLAAGALAPTAWLALTTLIDSDGRFQANGGIVEEAHPLFFIGALVQVIAIVVGYRATRSAVEQPSDASTASGHAPTAHPAAPPADRAPIVGPTVSPAPAVPPARHADVAGADEFDTSPWSTEQFRAIRDRLDERGVVYTSVDGYLRVGRDARTVTERIIVEVMAGPSPS